MKENKELKQVVIEELRTVLQAAIAEADPKEKHLLEKLIVVINKRVESDTEG
jgi:hypothetical protein